MVEIYVTVNEYGEVYTSSAILGVKGEKNARQLVFDAPVYSDCTYEVWFNAGSNNPYSASVTNNRCTVPSSVLTNETVSLQWVALSGNQIMAKSKVWNMVVITSLDDNNIPIPTFEDAVTVLQQINSIIPNEGSKNDVLIKMGNADKTLKWQSLSQLAKATAFSQVFVVTWDSNASQEVISANISAIKSYANATFPKHLILKYNVGNSTKYLNLSSISISGTVFDIMFTGNIAGTGNTVTSMRITLNIATDEYSQYIFNDWTYFQGADKAKLATIDSGAEVNVIEQVKVNGNPLTVTDKAVNITVPSLENYCTEMMVRGIVNNAIASITNGDEVSY